MRTRRNFLFGALAAAGSAGGWAARAPVKIAHREGNMLRESSPAVYELAASIGGISGIEVQTVRSKLWEKETALAYKRESNRWGVPTISMGGVIPQGASLVKPSTADEPHPKHGSLVVRDVGMPDGIDEGEHRRVHGQREPE